MTRPFAQTNSRIVIREPHGLANRRGAVMEVEPRIDTQPFPVFVTARQLLEQNNPKGKGG